MNRSPTILGLLLSVPEMLAGTFYIDSSSGNDLGPGSEAQPWETIDHATSVANPGDIMIVQPGTYQEYVVLSRAGNAANPITWQGAAGFTSIIDPSVAVSSGWALSGADRDPAGNGVYKRTGLPFTPDVLIMDGRFVLTVSRVRSTPSGPLYFRFDQTDPDGSIGTATWINAPANQVRSFGSYAGPYWDGLEALWGWTNSTAYVRLRSGGDVNTHSIRIAQNGGNIGTEVYTHPALLIQASYNRVYGFQIRNAAAGVIFQPLGSGTVRESVVRSNYVHTCWQPIVIDQGNTHSNAVIDNFVGQNWYAGSSAGAWRDQNNSDWEEAHFYSFAKNISSRNQSSPNALNSFRSGSSNLISGNLVTNCVNGIQAGDWTTIVGRGTVVRSNTVLNVSSVGVAIGHGNGHDQTFIHDNRVANANIGFRVQNINTIYAGNANTVSRIYYYRNTFWSPNNKGVPFYVHTGSQTGTHKPTVWVYHNSFEGGSDGFSGFTSNTPQYASLSLLQNFFWINNIVNVGNTIQHETSSGSLGRWAYNRFREIGPAASGASYYGPGNQFVSNPGYEWGTATVPPTTEPDFELVAGSVSIGHGIPVHETFTLGSTQYPALPGYAGGGVYYGGTQSDIGAKPFNFTPPGEDPITNVLDIISDPPFNQLADADPEDPNGIPAVLIVRRAKILVGGVLVDNTNGDCPFTYTTSSPDGAVGDVDYAEPSGSGTILAGQTQVQIEIETKRNPAFHGQRRVFVTLEEGAAYELSGTTQVELTLLDRDSPPGLIIRPQPEPGHGQLPRTL